MPHQKGGLAVANGEHLHRVTSVAKLVMVATATVIALSLVIVVGMFDYLAVLVSLPYYA